MTEERPELDYGAAESIADRGDAAAEAREAVEAYIRSHDVIVATEYVLRRTGTNKVVVKTDFDADAVSRGEVVGVTVYADQTKPPSLRYKRTHGHRSKYVPKAKDTHLNSAIDFVDSAAFKNAAIEAVDSLTEEIIEAADKLE